MSAEKDGPNRTNQKIYVIKLAIQAHLGLSSYCRFLAEAPDLEQKRMRDSLSWIVSIQNGAGIVFILPLLVQNLDYNTETRQRELWATEALRAHVRSHFTVICYGKSKKCFGISTDKVRPEAKLPLLGITLKCH